MGAMVRGRAPLCNGSLRRQEYRLYARLLGTDDIPARIISHEEGFCCPHAKHGQGSLERRAMGLSISHIHTEHGSIDGRKQVVSRKLGAPRRCRATHGVLDTIAVRKPAVRMPGRAEEDRPRRSPEPGREPGCRREGPCARWGQNRVPRSTRQVYSRDRTGQLSPCRGSPEPVHDRCQPRVPPDPRAWPATFSLRRC
jgi:hypothetical protein